MSPTRRDFLKTGLATATSLTLFDGASPVAAAAQAPPVPAPAADAFAVDVANAALDAARGIHIDRRADALGDAGEVNALGVKAAVLVDEVAHLIG